MIQNTVFVVTIVFMLVVTGAFAFVALKANSEAVDYPPLQEKSYSFGANTFTLAQPLLQTRSWRTSGV